MFTEFNTGSPALIGQARSVWRFALLGAMALGLAACGGGSTGGSSGNSAFATPPVVAAPTPVASSLVVTSSLATLPADGSITADIKVLVRDASNVVLPGAAVTLQTSSGALTVGKATTDSVGEAHAALSTAGDPASRTITVTVKAGTLTSTVNVAVGVPATTSLVSAVTLISSASSIPGDGSAPATVAAIVRDANNLLMAGVPVSFAATSGGLAVTQAVTDLNGQAVAILSTAGDSNPRTITVTSTVGSKSAQVKVDVAASVPPTSISMGSGTGTGFKPNVLGLGSSSLSVGGSTSVTVTLVQSGGTLYDKPASITFNSPCVAAGTAAIQPAATATTSTGQLTVTYVAKGCAGSDQIQATAAVGSQNLLATGTVTVERANVGSIAFVSATPTNIALKGTGDVGRPEVSTVVFRVFDVSGGPRAGATVNFTLSSTVGGINLTAASGTSDAQGNVQATVNAGTVATTVRVTAQVVGSSNISTQSSQLTVSSGLATQGSFSMAPVCANVEALEYDGTIAPLTVRLADRFSNPVPDGTAVSFMAEAGSIQAQCTTGTTATEGGLCTVNWRSSNPRMPDGRVSVLATAIGEESFVDADGDGVFSTGDTFRKLASGGLPAHDLGEPWLDLNENGSYEVGEPFYDFYNNAALGQAGLRDGPDGTFNGPQCKEPNIDPVTLLSRCPDLVADPARKYAPIGVQGIIIMSGSHARMSALDGGTIAPKSIALKQSGTVTVWVRDINGNPMPGGSTVTGTISGSGLTLGDPSTFTMGCSAQSPNVQTPGLTVFSFNLTATAVGSGLLTISVKTPKGNETLTQVSITVP